MSIRDYLRSRPPAPEPPGEPTMEPAWPSTETVMQRRDRLRAEREAMEAASARPEAAGPGAEARMQTAMIVLDTARQLIADRPEADVKAVRLLIDRAIELLGRETK